jgi:NADH:ubiquinone oxidoreductase subunit 6 (subunit J)
VVSIEQVIFYCLAFFIIFTGVLVVTLKNIFRAGVALVLCFTAVACIYLVLNADFLFAVQILVYVGAIAILILFGIMLTSKISARYIRQTNEQKILSLLVCLGTLWVIISVILGNKMIGIDKAAKFMVAPVIPEAVPTTHEIGMELMRHYALPFEVASVLLLVAMVGAIIFLRSDKKEDTE